MEHPNSTPPGSPLRFELKKPRPEVDLFSDFRTEDAPSTPSEWFARKFPSQAEEFGAPLLEGRYLELDQSFRTKPVALNEDFFAAILGGDKTLGHRVVYYLPEEEFYFYDHRHDCFLATTEDKLKFVLSQYLIRCGEEMGAGVDVKDLFDLRSDKVLGTVIRKARSLLAAEESFFGLESGNTRIKGPEFHGKIVKVFTREAIVPSPSQVLTVTECYEVFGQFCQDRGMKRMKRSAFTHLMADMVRDEYNVNVRNDIMGKNNRYQQGWKGLSARMEVVGAGD
jgi:hypothetical protein